VIKKEGLENKAEKYDGIEEVVGELLAKGEIVARFNGRVEWGPRALGNRSILADPRDFRVVRKLNSAIKQRDFWMPFAPTILEERMHEYLVNARPARYMILAFDTTEKRDEIIAAIHPQDFTARPQTLNEWNPSYRKILKTFEKITGVGAILNTSFNLHGYPIVGTPELAIWTFKNSGLKYLAIGNYLIKK
jgi:carbamoyltransferase